MAIKNSFARMTGGNSFTRKWGTRSSSVDPYITGYHFTSWAYLPPSLTNAVGQPGGWSQGYGQGAIKNILQSSCLSVTIPGGTLNKAEFNGLGNIRWAAPSNVDYDNNCSMRFLEASGLPIHSIMHGWIRLIRDYRTGVSLLTQGESYTKANYSGTVYYWTTEPNGIAVEYHCCMTGLFPARDPSDQFGHDITAYDKLEIDIDFNVDYLWHENWTLSYCRAKAKQYYGDGAAAVDNYAGQDGQDG